MVAWDVPINSVSFGQVSYNILYNLFERGYDPQSVFVNQEKADIGAYIPDEKFSEWLRDGMRKALSAHDRSVPALKLWHIRGIMSSFSEEANAYVFHETDRLTEFEAHALSTQKRVFVSSTYTKKVFEEAGLENVIYCPLGFDKRHFFKIDRPNNFHTPSDPRSVDRNFSNNFKGVTFGLRGKLEIRKHTLRVLAAWAKKYGDNWDYRLDCSIFNPFLDASQQEQLIRNALGGHIPANINFLPMQAKNVDYNQCLNAVDIDLTGMSGGEGFNLPLFQSLGLGKWAVVLNAHVHKDFANKENAILVEPKEEMIAANDGVFFLEGENFNQGKWFDFDDEEFISAMEEAEKLAGSPNPAGEDLVEKFSYSRMVDTILGEF